MKKSPLKALFIMTMVLSTLMSVTANSWLGVWMGLEINMISFIPLMSYDLTHNLEVSSIKYFIVQTIASITLIMAFITFMLSKPNQLKEGISMMMTLALAMKIGGSPMHFWLPEVMENLSWNNCIILMTWQKIAPMVAISYIKSNNPLMVIIIMSSAVVGAVMGMNQISLRMLMAYSSINHVGWLLAAIKTNMMIWLLYLVVYSLLTTLISYVFKSTNNMLINELFFNYNNSKPFKFTLMTSMLSLGGMPPLLGFLPSWILIQELASQSSPFMLMTLILSSTITLYFYMKLFVAGGVLSLKENKWNLNNISMNKTSISCIMMNATSIVGLTLSLLTVQ
uniref:NADH-ubiquinone oxidoreductase chain 2 n=1 Tax=Scelimena sp. 1 XDL-2023a TaxID=3071528 RepID=A0AA50RZF8_9ORTH|nr:NADH dehydrogenase subunit 2 [Scelimena sp. 1 XDL-2023a]